MTDQPPTEPPALSIVSPCYDEEACLREMYRRTSAAAKAAVGQSYEIVLVNDGSRDATWEIMRALSAVEPQLVAINLSRNFGQQSALTAGLMQARGQRVLVLDADLQDPPELIGEMMRLMDAGADVVYGQRRERSGETRFKNATSKLFYRVLQRLIEIEIPRDTGDFRLMNRKTLDVFKTFPEQFRFVRGLVSWVGGVQVPLIYDRDARVAGETKWPVKRLVRLAIDALTGFSTVPLRIASYMGLLMGLLSILMLFYTLGSWLLGVAITGWTSLTSIVLVIGSVQLLVLGVFGEYLGRMYLESKRRPLFVVSEILSGQAGTSQGRTA